MKSEPHLTYSYLLYQDNKLVFEGNATEYSFKPEIARRYSFQLKAVNVVGPSQFSSSYDVFIPPPPVVKEVVRKREPRDPFSRIRMFTAVKNEAAENVLEKKRKKNWLKLWWKEYSALVYIAVIFIGIFVLVNTTLK